MGASKYGVFCDSIAMGINYSTNEVQHNSWGALAINGDADNNICDSDSTMSSSFYSSSSSSSADLVDDATSSSSSSPSSPQLNNGPLYDLSDLMSQLPIKRGLSNHFQGKSQSFISLTNVSCIEDLAKRENPFRKRIKSCKSYGGLDGKTNKSFTPKTCSKMISKKVERTSFLSPVGKRNCHNNGPRSPFSLLKNF